MFADNIEATIGPWRFLIFYMAGGVLATAAHVYMNPLSDVPCVGASGAIAACLGAYLFLFPGSRVRVLFLLFFTTFEVPALLFLGIWIVQQFLAGVGSLGALTTDTSGVAYWSHIGGFGFGLLSALWIRSRSAFRRMEEED